MIDVERLLCEISEYVPADPAEEDCVRQVRDLLLCGENPFTRANPHHVTGSAIVAQPDGSAFLLVYHRRLDRWLQPGGHVELEDPSVLATALREAGEETGVRSLETPLGERILDVDVHPIPASADRPAHVHYDLRYLATTDSDAIRIDPEEVRDAAWFTLEEALAAGADGSLARALCKAKVLLGSPDLK